MIAVAADIALAHRRFKHREEDVGLLGCRVEEDGPIWFNKVGDLRSGLCGLPLCEACFPAGATGDAPQWTGSCVSTAVCR